MACYTPQKGFKTYGGKQIIFSKTISNTTESVTGHGKKLPHDSLMITVGNMIVNDCLKEQLQLWANHFFISKRISPQ